MLQSMVSEFSECCGNGYLLVTRARVAGDNVGTAAAAGDGHAELGGGAPNNLGYRELAGALCNYV